MNDPGRIITAQGSVAPEEVGRVLMHEHLHFDCWDWENGRMQEEAPISEERRALLMDEAIPYLAKLNEHDCHAFVEASPPPFRAWPDFYVDASRAAGIHIVLCTGFYREVETGTYWVSNPKDAIWPFAREASVDEMADFCIGELLDGIHGTEVRAGAIKLASSAAEFTEAEEKAFRAGARAQKASGAHITTHCTALGAEETQIRLLDEEGVPLSRVVVGHTAGHLADPERRKNCLKWMERGVSFLPTNLSVDGDIERWRPLVEAIHEIFDAGHGDKICFGLDWAFCSESGPFGACTFMPPPPFLYMFTDILPAFRELGLTPEEEEVIMLENPRRILSIQ
ncbi:MAG: hypothetical protein KGZ25_03770 [Planctomycetes bacterium]|nr:hypothetical protein [Planctomycetota bacterium]